MSITVPDWLLISATRYALGRSSYVVSDTALEIQRCWHNLESNTREVITRDILAYLRDSGRDDRYRGVDQPWRELVPWMRENAKDGP